MRVLQLPAILLVAGLAGAQNPIQIPAYSSTYTYVSHTRGFNFQAPVDFTIVGLRVPDEQRFGKQNVAVYRLNAQAPTYPAMGTGGLVFFKAGEPSPSIIPCNIRFTTGEWIGLLGACGDTNIMHSSYGAPTPYRSQVLGHATTLYRFGTQTNIVASLGKGPYWGQLSSQLGRIEVYATSTALSASGTGAPGTSMVFTLSSPSDGGLLYQLGSSFGTGPIPIDTRKLHLSPDDLLILSTGGAAAMIFQDYSGNLDAQGNATARLNIPNLPVLKGVRIHSAFLTIQATAPSGVSSISSTILFTIQ